MSTLYKYQQEAVDILLNNLKPENYKNPVVLHLATGGGKTRVANEIILNILTESKRSILWVTKDWRLLNQAKNSLSFLHSSLNFGKIGDKNNLNLKDVIDVSEKSATYIHKNFDVIYSTIQTLARRINDGILTIKPIMVVWDECHWGDTENSKSGPTIAEWCREYGIALLGLTATPRKYSASDFDVVYSKSFFELVSDGFLAYPFPADPIHTGVYWRPEISQNDFSELSIQELARNKKRNDFIVDAYHKGRNKYKKTIIFACDIGHANKLSELFNVRIGIPARPIHSHLDSETINLFIQDFKDGKIDVLINVAMMTHGIDIPDIKTVFLCRPTSSDILFAQMIGRAARRSPGKDSFNIIEFTDNIAVHGELLRTAKTFFSGTEFDLTDTSANTQNKYVNTFYKLTYDPYGAGKRIPPNNPVFPKEISDLWFREGQTFGIEFELTSSDFETIDEETWMERANELISILKNCLGHDLVAKAPYPEYKPNKNYELWNVEKDNSCGWEITSRVLEGESGYLEVLRVCNALRSDIENLGLMVNHRTGTHIHLAWMEELHKVKDAIKIVNHFEPALATLVAPSRIVSFSYEENNYEIDHANRYCQSIGNFFNFKKLAKAESIEEISESFKVGEQEKRYTTFNIQPLAEIQTVEIRLHNGTIDGGKILLWLSLWQQILWFASDQSNWEEPWNNSKVIEPSGDIVSLAKKYLPEGNNHKFLERLHARRMEILNIWNKNNQLEHWRDYAKSWDTKFSTNEEKAHFDSLVLILEQLHKVELLDVCRTVVQDYTVDESSKKADIVNEIATIWQDDPFELFDRLNQQQIINLLNGLDFGLHPGVKKDVKRMIKIAYDQILSDYLVV